MKYIAHRGVVTVSSKENTLDAFNLAINDSKYSGFELDVRTSKDNIFVVFHDSLIDGALVKNLTFKELKEKGVNSLKEVLNLNTSKKILIEIKDFDINVYKLVKMLNKSDSDIYVMSFSSKVIEKISKLDYKFKIGVLNYILNTKEEYNYDFICLLYLSVNASLIEKYKEEKTEVFLYGVPKHLKIKDFGCYMIVDNDYLKRKFF